MDLDRALQLFDRTEINLRQLDGVVEQLEAMVPEGVVFASGSPEGRQHNGLRRRFGELAEALPSVDGFRVDVEPLSLDDIAQWRMDALSASLPESLVDLGQHIAAPGEAVAEYRHRFQRMRRGLIRQRVEQLIGEVDGLLAGIRERNPEEHGKVDGDLEWQRLRGTFSELQRLTAPQSGARGWSDLARHLSFAEAVDLHDIVERDWPTVRAAISQGMYADDEPLPVDAEDLASVVAQRPAGPVTTALAWDRLEPADFERLIFNLLGDASGYHNPQWLTATNAPDRGRDLSVERDMSDALGVARRQRVIVQCKHWRSRPVRPMDAVEAVTQAQGWQPPFDAVIVATSGRFTVDAVNWIEQHNRTDRLQVDMWPESHLETLLATRPWLVEQLGLRTIDR